jgi:hypothetical protein
MTWATTFTVLSATRKQDAPFAWTYRDGDQNKTVAVLEIPPVDSPQNAVKVAIASKAKKI